MNTSISKRIAFAGVMFALIFVVLMLETFVFIYMIKPSPAFLTIPLAISISVFDKKKMLVGGTLLGVASLILAFIIGYTDFYNPLISVFPRVIMGVVAYFVYEALTRAFENNKGNALFKKTLSSSIAGAAGVITNTIGVLGMMAIFKGDNAFMHTALSVIISINFIFEFVAAIILVPVFVKTLRRLQSK